jgi:anti-sigma B factor antagonist
MTALQPSFSATPSPHRTACPRCGGHVFVLHRRDDGSRDQVGVCGACRGMALLASDGSVARPHPDALAVRLVAPEGPRDGPGRTTEVVVVVCGEVDMATAPLVVAAATDALASRPRRLVIDLAAVTFLDSSGVHGLVVASQQADELGVGYEVRHPSAPSRKVLDLMGLTGPLHVTSPAPPPRHR